jgi:hypothetical protein
VAIVMIATRFFSHLLVSRKSSLVQNLTSIGFGNFSRLVPEKCPLPLQASIAHTTFGPVLLNLRVIRIARECSTQFM